MKFKDLLPLKTKKTEETEPGAPTQMQTQSQMPAPFTEMQNRMNEMFSDFFRGFGDLDFPLRRSFDFAPSMDLEESDQEIEISMELPGVNEEDIDISLAGNELLIQGEKRTEDRETGKGFQRLERSYGSFQRSVLLPCEVRDTDISAVFRNGVLKITLPKTEEACRKTRRIAVKSG